MIHGLLHQRTTSPSGDLYRMIEIYGDESEERDAIYVKVGNLEGDGVVMDDDLKVAKNANKALNENGYKVVANPFMPPLSRLTPEETTLITGSFTVERIVND